MARHIDAHELRKHLDARGVKVSYEDGWASSRIDPYGPRFVPVGVILHHTAGRNSLAYCMRGSFPPVRNCQFLIARDGTVHCIAGAGCYHAGLGGPMTINGYRVPKDLGNQHFYGIEIESLGTESGVHDPLNDPTPNGMTEEQVLATAELTAALCELVDGDETAVIRHKDWAPNRKVDVKQSLEFWRARVALQLKANRMEDAYQVLAKAEKDPSVKTQETRDLAVKLSKLGYYTGPVKPVGEQGFPRVAFSKWKASSMVPTAIGYTREAHARLWQA